MEAQYQSDKFYKSSYNKYKSHDLMISAGWINEIQNNNGIKIDYSLDLLTTPLSGLSFSSKKKNKILSPIMKNKLNLEVKHRENWRPFCPSILEEDYEKYIDSGIRSRFMTIALPVKKNIAKIIPSCVHVDGTVRAQMVDKKNNYK